MTANTKLTLHSNSQSNLISNHSKGLCQELRGAPMIRNTASDPHETDTTPKYHSGKNFI